MWELDEGFGGPYERFARGDLEAAVSSVMHLDVGVSSSQIYRNSQFHFEP